MGREREGHEGGRNKVVKAMEREESVRDMREGGTRL